MSRLGLGLGLTKGGIPPFNPLSLDPYLLFDTQSSMIGTFENPTLDLDPSDPDTLDVITATRSGVATYTDADGVIQSASADTVRVDHVQGEELTPTVYQRVGYTDFSQNWSLVRCTVEDGNGYSGQPSKIVTATGDTIFYRINCPTSAGVVYTASVYVRLISGTGTFRINHQNSPTNSNTIIPITTEWQRVEAEFIGLGGSTPVGVSGMLSGDVIEVSSLQVEEGTTATDFVENTTGSPKFIAPATYGPRVPMILVEPSATNLVEYSEDFDGSYWSANNLTITPNAASLGIANVSLIQESTYTSAVPVIQHTSFGNTSGQHTFSFYVKNNNNTRYLGFTFGSSTERIRDTFDLQTETFKGSIFSGTTTGSVSFDRLGDYYRINVTATFPSPVTVQVAIAPLATNGYLFYFNQDSGNRSFYLWGAQVEAGSVATSYIPTSGSTVTRQADNLVIDGSDFTDFYNQSEGTFYAESVLKLDTNVSFIFDVNDGGDQERNLLYYPDSNNLRVLIRKNNVTNVNLSIGSRPSVGVLSRAAFGYATNDLKGSVDGGAVLTDTSVTLPTTLNKINIGSHVSLDNAYYLNGRIRRLLFWPYSSDRL